MRKGFTIVELLAVIVIVSILLTIFIPIVTNTISNSKEKAFTVDAKNVLRQVEYKILEKNVNLDLIDETNIQTIFNIDPINYEKIAFTKMGGELYILMKGKNKWDGLIIYGTYTNLKIEKNADYNLMLKQIGYNSIKGVNEPKLSVGMTPIKWNGTSWVDTKESDEEWYDYNSKIWANARTEDGSMWVWIPRYIYKITSGWHSLTTGTIDLKFSMGKDDTIGNTITLDTGTTSNASNNKWTNHPGFTFGSTELTGIWVAKFEPTAVEGVANGYTSDSACPIAGDNVTTKTVKVIPNVASWRCITANNAFLVTRKMELSSKYGWDTASNLQSNGTYETDTNNIDTHLMKNLEWGAIAYLSKSIYGKNTVSVWPNPSRDYITGCAGVSIASNNFAGCPYDYTTSNGKETSTTGNIYGIYDMSGGAWERVSSYINNGNSVLTTYGSSLLSADNKYKELYEKATTDNAVNNYALAIQYKGDAVYETSSSTGGVTAWFSDGTSMPCIDNPFFMRGARWNFSNDSGIFVFWGNYGNDSSVFTFRPVIAVNKGL